MSARKLGRLAGLVFVLAALFGGVGAGTSGRSTRRGIWLPPSTTNSWRRWTLFGSDARADRYPPGGSTDRERDDGRRLLPRRSSAYAWLITWPLALFALLMLAHFWSIDKHWYEAWPRGIAAWRA